MDSIISLLTPKRVTFFINEDMTIRQVLEKLDVHRFSVVPILDEQGRYRGTLSEGDILRFIKNVSNFNVAIAENVLVKDIDHYRPYSFVRVDALISEVFALSLEQNFIPVVDDKDIYIGIIKRRDVIKYLSDHIDIKFNNNEE